MEELKQVSLEDALNGEGDTEMESLTLEPTQEDVKTEPEAAQDAPTEPNPVDEVETPTQEEEKPWTYHMAMDEKQKRKDIERERDELKARMAALEYQQRQNQPKPELPDMLSDPEAYNQAIQQQAIAPVMPIIQSLQRQLAETRHTPEAVHAANDWFDTLAPQQQQAINLKYGNSQDPFGDLVREHKRTLTLEQVGNDPSEWDAFQAWKASQGQAQATPPQVSQQQPNSQVKIMPSATKSPSMAARSGPKWAGPSPLSAILPE